MIEVVVCKLLVDSSSSLLLLPADVGIEKVEDKTEQTLNLEVKPPREQGLLSITEAKLEGLAG